MHNFLLPENLKIMDVIKEFRGKKYKKVHDGEMNSKDACTKHCSFCLVDEYGEHCCGNPNNIDPILRGNNDPEWDGCANGNFHWEEVE